MAYFRKRGASWSYTIDVGKDPKTGNRMQKTKSGFRTKTEAKSAAALLEVDLQKGRNVRNKDPLFKDFADEWIAVYKATGLVKSSSVHVRSDAIKVLNRYFGFVRLKEIDPRDYQNMILKLRNIDKLSINYIKSVHATASLIFKKAMEFEMIYVNPSSFALMPAEKKSVEDLEMESIEDNYLEKDELIQFLKVTLRKGMPGDYEIFTTLAYTGMRAGELCALMPKDIDYENNKIRITKTLFNPNNKNGDHEILTPKTKKANRTIYIDQDLAKILKRYKVRYSERSLKNRIVESEFFFRKTGKGQGKPFSVRTIEYRFKRLLSFTGIKKEISPHALRHTHTSLLAEAGVSLEEIMERLGHKDDKITREVYLHKTKVMQEIAIEKKKDAVNKFGELMKSEQSVSISKIHIL